MFSSAPPVVSRSKARRARSASPPSSIVWYAESFDSTDAPPTYVTASSYSVSYQW